MKKFRKYKKKEKKAWRKFHKKSQKYFEKQDVFDLKGEDKFDATAWKRGKLELKKEIERKQKELSETVGRRVNFFFLNFILCSFSLVWPESSTGLNKFS